MAARYSAPTPTPQTGCRDAGLPDYVVERNRLASEAGLIMTKQVVRNGKLTTWYEGTETQWRYGPFGSPRAKPFREKKGAIVSGYFETYSPIETHGVNRFQVTAMGSGRYRGSIVKEPLPEWIEDVGDGITAYAGHEGRLLAIYYVGPLGAMRERNIVSKEALDKPSEWNDYIILQDHSAIQFLDDGRIIFRDAVGAREQKADEEDEKRKKNYISPSAMLAHWATVTETWSRMYAEMFKRVETKRGKVFTVTPDSMSTIQTLTEELIDAIRCAQVSMREARADMGPAIAAARADRAFSQFLRRTSPDNDTQPPH